MRSTTNSNSDSGAHSGVHARFLAEFTQANAPAFSLDVDLLLPGEGITAVFGQSGSGKTTLLRCLAGLQRAQQGLLTVNDETWQDDSHFVPTHRRSLGYVFQESSLLPHLTAQGNLRYALKRSSRCDARTYDHIIQLMGIETVLQRYPMQMSGGERQRVAIARALVIQPKLLLMDEPLASLDSARKQEILPYLERLKSRFRLPIIYISHAVEEVSRLADYVVSLQAGRVFTQGRPEHVFSQLNLPGRSKDEISLVFEGKVKRTEAQWHMSLVDFEGFELWVQGGENSPGSTVRVRINASDVSLSLSADIKSSILNKIPATVRGIQQDDTSSSALVQLDIGGHTLVSKITQYSCDYLQLAPGVAVWTQVKSTALLR